MTHTTQTTDLCMQTYNSGREADYRSEFECSASLQERMWTQIMKMSVKRLCNTCYSLVADPKKVALHHMSQQHVLLPCCRPKKRSSATRVTTTRVTATSVTEAQICSIEHVWRATAWRPKLQVLQACCTSVSRR